MFYIDYLSFLVDGNKCIFVKKIKLESKLCKMLRSYNTTNKFQFGIAANKNNSIINNMTYQDAITLNKVENEINNLVSRIESLQSGNINTINLDLIIQKRLSSVIKNILTQYEIRSLDKQKWCGIRKYTIIKLDKIIPRIITKPIRNNSTPLEHIVSNAINIPNMNRKKNK